jgi:hypothetical protein
MRKEFKRELGQTKEWGNIAVKRCTINQKIGFRDA